jgi:predicted amidophosphoribosyltransferase
LSILKQLAADMVCTFCNAKIDYGKSVCDACAKKYNIGAYDMGSDGCGCDG